MNLKERHTARRIYAYCHHLHQVVRPFVNRRNRACGEAALTCTVGEHLFWHRKSQEQSEGKDRLHLCHDGVLRKEEASFFGIVNIPFSSLPGTSDRALYGTLVTYLKSPMDSIYMPTVSNVSTVKFNHGICVIGGTFASTLFLEVHKLCRFVLIIKTLLIQ